MFDRVAQNDRVAAIAATHTHGRLVGVLVILDMGEWHALHLETVTELDVQQLDRDVVSCPHLGELVEQTVPFLSGPLVDDVRPALFMLCHVNIVGCRSLENSGNDKVFGDEFARSG